MNLGDYVIINNSKMGKIVNKPDDNMVVKLDNNAKHVNRVLEQYQHFLPSTASNILGYDFVTKNDFVEPSNSNNLKKFILLELKNPSFETFENLDYMFNKQYETLVNSISTIKQNYEYTTEKKINNNVTFTPKFIQNNISKYQDEDKKDDNYEKYIQIMLERLFIDDDDSKTISSFNDNKSSVQQAEDEQIVVRGTKKDIIQPVMLEYLQQFLPITDNLKWDFSSSVLYNHITINNNDIHAIGQQMIYNIETFLLSLQKEMKYDNGEPILGDINIFDYLLFKISNGYVVIESKQNSPQSRVITPELVPNLNILKNNYGYPINYKQLSPFVTQNSQTIDTLQNNKDVINEAMKIMAQEYIISMQPDVNIIYWCLCRLIMAWYADPILSSKIYKIKILINLYRSRGAKTFNKDEDIQPIISVYPFYGRKIAMEVASKLNYYFFAYKNMGFSENKPTYFEKFDDLMCYTNGSIELKKYIKYIMNKGNKVDNEIMNKNFTALNLSNSTLLYENNAKK